MPVKWDAMKDQFILIQLIADKTTNISNKQYEEIIKAWPATLGEKPTLRAITEHFIKIRKGPAGTPTSTPIKSENGKAIKPRTPRTPANKKTSSPTKKGQGQKRNAKAAFGDSEEEAEAGADDDNETEDEAQVTDLHSRRVMLSRSSKTPESRAKMMKGMVSDGEDGGEGYESDGSEFKAGILG